MEMLMRVEVCGVFPDQAPKSGKLPGRLPAYGLEVFLGNNLVKLGPIPISATPFSEVEMQPHTQAWAFFGIGGGLESGRPQHHEAGAGDDPCIVRFDNAAIHTGTLPEVIGIHNQESFPVRRPHPQSTASLSSLPSTFTCRKHSLAIARAARLWLQ